MPDPRAYPDGHFCEGCGWPDIAPTSKALFPGEPKTQLCSVCIEKPDDDELRAAVLAGRERAKQRAEAP